MANRLYSTGAAAAAAKCSMPFSAPDNNAARQINIKYGNVIRARSTVNANLSGYVGKSRREHMHQLRHENLAEDRDRAQPEGHHGNRFLSETTCRAVSSYPPPC